MAAAIFDPPPPTLSRNPSEGVSDALAPKLESVRSVVVVDDMAMNCLVLEMQCRSLGVTEIRCFRSGPAVLDYLGSCRGVDLPDVILSDLAMPEMDGATLAKAVKGKWPGIPIVAVTAEFEPERERKYDLSLFSVVLSKELDSERLRSVLDGLSVEGKPNTAHEV